ncbi:chemotaxis protein CheA [Clostridiaceae bacterium HSG29]|nr:chemotaxis protein CheA [Clostridiaceae bacterium HSG29]
MSGKVNDSMVELYLSEAYEIINSLELLIIESEETKSLENNIDIIFRNMHTIKGNSMMMMYDSIAGIAHKIEDLFDFIRANKDVETDYSILADIVLSAIDFIKEELNKIENGIPDDGDPEAIIDSAMQYLESLKFMNPDSNEISEEKTKKEVKYYIASTNKKEKSDYTNYFVHLQYYDDIEMANIRGLTALKKIESFGNDIYSNPKEILKSESSEFIKEKGISFIFKTEKKHEYVNLTVEKIAFLKNFELKKINEKKYNDYRIDFDNEKDVLEKEEDFNEDVIEDVKVKNIKKAVKENRKVASHMSTNIKVDLEKIDYLMDLVGELVVSGSMVNEERNDENTDVEMTMAERQLNRVINELQDAVMSIRMVPLKLTFQKMKRIVRDTSKKVKKEIDLKIIGEETEVDKNVIEKLGDPLMHIIRNSVDHGIEDAEVRLNYNKTKIGNITLAAKQTAGNVIITIKDDGGGLDKERILDKASNKKMLIKPRTDYTDEEIYMLLFEPGFSTNESVTELSGRGVGLDVVKQNIKALNGTVEVRSQLYKGTEFIIKIPLTLAIINGVLIEVSDSIFIIPTVSIIESYAMIDQKVFVNGDGNEMIMIRDEVYPLLRLNTRFAINEEKCNDSGIITMVENENRKILIHSDRIIGKQQVVVKHLSGFTRKVNGISGYALLGDGRISFILNPSDLST